MDALRSVITLTSGSCQGWHLWIVSCPGNRLHFLVFCMLSNYGSCPGRLNIALWGCFPVHADVFLVVRFCSRVAVSTLKLRPQVCFVISCAMVSRSVWFCGSVPRARSRGGSSGLCGLIHGRRSPLPGSLLSWIPLRFLLQGAPPPLSPGWKHGASLGAVLPAQGTRTSGALTSADHRGPCPARVP